MIRFLQGPEARSSGFLRRRFQPRYRIAAGFWDAVPLVNLALLLYIFHLVQSPFVLQPGLLVNLPASPFHSGVPYGARVVTMTQSGLIFFNDERMTLETLSTALAQWDRERPETTLLIEADGRVLHETLVRVYNMALASGIEKVVLATRPPQGGRAAP